jgi:hypothetical protein
MVYGSDPKKLYDKELSIPSKDSPSSAVSMVKKSLF